ncbi:uncharacterized protein LOC125503015 [Dendroctonus ponderosae]|uniref:uncharacterized protein LOC125503015 n=1 Tax=Dendroctonus ponderosae TaxID=77166 RepID=UPI00203618F5|nr:uncharacterized protein LOC125503015 [Dendroctonus ponderosae]KAH1026387.1 hypothetical protein HUJ05_000061 [Dendroctonus ponderosae]
MLQAGAIWILILIKEITTEEHPIDLVDVNALTALPLNTLLNIKRNIVSFDAVRTPDNATAKENGPEALPFHALLNKQHEFYAHVADEEGSKYQTKGISKVFQTSVTSLAFLAFGGYLLFLIIAAIKAKQQNYMYDPNTAQIMQAMINAQINKRKKKKRRPIRGDGSLGYKGQDSLEFQPYKQQRAISHSDVNVDGMYKALLDLCEGYRKIVNRS